MRYTNLNSWVACALLLVTGQLMADDGKHLFILSGQSNMQGHRPQEAFRPAVEKALGKANIIVIQDALGGQPIQRWWKDWKSPKGENPAKTGDLYDRLMGKVNPAIKGQALKSVTFIWMQGERDAKERQGEVYEKSLAGLVKQLSDDLGRDDMNFVIGRLSDCMNKNPGKSHWMEVRKAQIAVAEKNPRGAWVDTDDLNGPKDDLHYNKEGYAELGKRFAEKAVELVKKGK